MNLVGYQIGLAGGAILALYFAVLCILAIFGIHRLYLVCLYLANRHRYPRWNADATYRWPTVTVQLPIFNEYYVIDRLLDAVAELDYPRELLQVQVLDDSTDETAARARRRVAGLAATGLDIVHVRRSVRTGFKAGALAEGLSCARGEFVCIFDADFVPPGDFLRRVLPYFADPNIGMVQARWEHLNRGFSLLTRIQAMLLDAHFAIEQAARSWSGRCFNFNGTAGIWRRQAIEQAGGWHHDTLTEDMDISYRAQLQGWRFLYVDVPAAPAELPVSIGGFKQQQHRWTKGAVQTANKLLGTIWRSTMPRSVKLEATFHLTANLAYPLMVGLSLLMFPAALVRQPLESPGLLALDMPLLLCATGSVCAFYLVAQRAVGRPWAGALLRLPALMALGIGISLNNTVAVIEGLQAGTGEFVRTPKYGVIRPRHRWRHKRYRDQTDWLPWLEIAFGLYLTAATGLALFLGLWEALPFLLVFQAGYLAVGGLSLWQRPPRRSPASAGLAPEGA